MKRQIAFEDRVVRSALWAAAGDALGWISELTDQRGVMRRTSGKRLAKPVQWKRRIGGMSGPDISFPAGSYSDDTQLRLAVCRSIDGGGNFDVEAFAKVELTVWPSFALGAGRGTKAAAANLQRRDVAWFSNFFASPRGPRYTEAGGNGAAMRVQPHVWRHGGKRSAYMPDVIRDSVVTHGHVYGICGAVFHADCVAQSIALGQAPAPRDWRVMVEALADIEHYICTDDQLRRFWIKAWEAQSETTVTAALDSVRREMLADIDVLEELGSPSKASYAAAIDALQGRGARQGAGTNTALAAAYAAWAFESSVEDALVVVASEIGSDTDTIGTMAGAILGINADSEPKWEIQDRDYIRQEAVRLARIADGQSAPSFQYPDLATWAPPSAQSDVLGEIGSDVVVAGLGCAELLQEAGSAGAFCWTWVRLAFGQTILCKRKLEGLPVLEHRQVQVPDSTEHASGPQQQDLLAEQSSHGSRMPSPSSQAVDKPRDVGTPSTSLDALTDSAIASGFEDAVLGKCLRECLESSEPLERAVAFAAIVSKAYAARRRAAAKSAK